MSAQADALKQSVAAHWQSEPCGTRGITRPDRRAFFSELERQRYSFEPHIERFAAFNEGNGKRVLEIGVGAGSDFVKWLRGGGRAIGIDMTDAAIQMTREHAEVEGLRPSLTRSDCEHLPFRSESFDIVYAYGVIHHSPDTVRAVTEIHRVLRPGGNARIMIYHAPSITGFMLWTVHCLLKLRPWRSPRWAVGTFLESPGTKAYTRAQARDLFKTFSQIRIETALGTGDLLLMEPSRRYRNPLAQVAWRLFPRWLIRRVGSRLGLALLVQAIK
jgi:ubiquinone/menaquinone biosynthesis C-methylase UbiE